jgi:hypothetical protein
MYLAPSDLNAEAPQHKMACHRGGHRGVRSGGPMSYLGGFAPATITMTISSKGS